ncbi:hypothetical protein BU61_4886 [Pontoporia blainvillei]|uniref:Uncharacterized protein n=1 Tax=Pontoporia blainvillei TaxID=48723 RepID=A0ABX0SDA2_PONBL|nr:hypothetical protein [Pontoporia blainvillei]
MLHGAEGHIRSEGPHCRLSPVTWPLGGAHQQCQAQTINSANFIHAFKATEIMLRPSHETFLTSRPLESHPHPDATPWVIPLSKLALLVGSTAPFALNHFARLCSVCTRYTEKVQLSPPRGAEYHLPCGSCSPQRVTKRTSALSRHHAQQIPRARSGDPSGHHSGHFPASQRAGTALSHRCGSVRTNWPLALLSPSSPSITPPD